MSILTSSATSLPIIDVAIHRRDRSRSEKDAGANVRIETGAVAWVNSSDLLPPVGCPLLIEIGDVLVQATRTGFIKSKSADMEYRLANGCLIHGRYRWTYP